jgi:hypothetical protein
VQAAPAPKLNTGINHFALQLNSLSYASRSDGIYSGSIFITEGQMKQKVLNIIYRQLLQFLLQRRTDSPELGEWNLTELGLCLVQVVLPVWRKKQEQANYMCFYTVVL